MSDSYYPSNGTEGDVFMSNNCYKCYKTYGCTILANSLVGKRPKQWIHKENHNAICTSFRETKPKRSKIKIDNNLKLF